MNIAIAKLALAALVGVLFVTLVSGQGKTFKLGAEVQAYPAGFIPGVRADLYLSDYSKVHARIGYNVVRHGDAGEHDDERGGGVGFTLGYDLLPFGHRWTIGARADLWFNEVDWYDVLPDQSRISGTSNVTVFQPTLQAGYRIPLSEAIELVPTVAFGAEINVKTEGEEIGQGAILLGGFVINFEL